MSNINFNLNSNNEDYNSLREAIFKRAREKAEALNTELKSGYTSDFKNDVMESARVSVRNNPFINLFEEETSVTEEPKVEANEVRPEIKHSRDWQPAKAKRMPSRLNNQLYTAAIREGAMREASATIHQNKSLMASLNFLNTQAAIALNKPFIRSQGDAPKEIQFGI